MGEQRFNVHAKYRLLTLVFLTAISSLVLMTFYEVLKQTISPNIQIWESHLITIVFTSTLATTAAYLIGRLLSRASTEMEGANRRLEHHGHQIALLNEMSGLLQSCQNSKQACHVVAQFAMRMLPGYAGALGATSESRNTVETIATWGENGTQERVFAPEDCWALRRGRAYAVEGDSPLLCPHLRPNTSKFSLCVPLVAQNETFGLLHLESSGTESEDGLSKESAQSLALALAEHASLAFANLELREKLRNQSIRDPLTGLFNRRCMEESLERELRRAVRHKRPLAVIMLDVDHFKSFNDSFGHAAGDAVLRSVAEALQARVRKEDLPCRYGGEEFAIILGDSPLQIACERAEELRRAIKSLKTEVNRQSFGPVTVSAGVASFPEHGSTPDVLVRAADEALYAAKEAGRDRVLAAEAGGISPEQMEHV